MNNPLSHLQKLRLREDQLFLALTILIGVIAGLSAVLFASAIDQVSHRFFGLAPSRLRLFLVPPIVSVVTGILLYRYFPDVRGSGVPQTKTAYYLTGGVIHPRVMIGKFLTGVLCIGSGQSMGREGPSVQIGASIASTIGRWLNLPPRLVRDLVPVGAAAALAAAFNTPLSAVVFTLEEIIGDMNATLLGSAVVASVTAVVVERSILGNEPLFHVPAYHLVHPAELIAYAVLGIIGGLISLLFCSMLLGLRARFTAMPEKTRMFQPAIGGLAIGLIIMYVPAVMGVGYLFVDQALNSGLVLKTMVMLCFVKIIATVLSYSSGNAGGIFAPSLFIGAMAGGAVGLIVHKFAPFPTADPGAYALVGMGALFAGIVRAPLTSVFMIFEITQDYQIVVPLMVANMLSFAISRRYQPVPIYEALLHQDNIHLPARPTETLRTSRAIKRIMRAPEPFTAPETTVHDALRQMEAGGESVLLVGHGNRLLGTIRHRQIQDAVDSGRGEESLEPLIEASFLHVHPDHAMDVVLERFEGSEGILPVIARADTQHVDGIITVDSITRYFNKRVPGKRNV